MLSLCFCCWWADWIKSLMKHDMELCKCRGIIVKSTDFQLLRSVGGLELNMLHGSVIRHKVRVSYNKIREDEEEGSLLMSTFWSLIEIHYYIFWTLVSRDSTVLFQLKLELILAPSGGLCMVNIHYAVHIHRLECKTRASCMQHVFM